MTPARLSVPAPTASWPAPDGPWSGEVLHVEDLGSDHYLFVEIGSDEPVIVRRPGKATIDVGAKVSLAPQAGHIYRFDADGKPVR